MLLQKLAATTATLVLLGFGTVNAEDTFNYYGTTKRSFGPADWKNVTCTNVETCVSWKMTLHSVITIVLSAANVYLTFFLLLFFVHLLVAIVLLMQKHTHTHRSQAGRPTGKISTRGCRIPQ
jgi:hypothetical protein